MIKYAYSNYKGATPEILKRMKQLRKNGLSYEKIAKELNFSEYTIRYHLNPKYRKNRLKGRKERYRKDKKFREKFKKSLRKSSIKRHKLIKKLRKKYQEYDKIIRLYFRIRKKIGYKKAYKIFKKRLISLRQKYNINFPRV
jgi:predicted transcriptional regulator